MYMLAAGQDATTLYKKNQEADKQEEHVPSKLFDLQFPAGYLQVEINNDETFNFKDKDNIVKGQYGIEHIIKYITQSIDPRNEILKDTNMADAHKIIEQTLIKFVNTDGKLVPTLLSNRESPMLKELDVLKVLNKMFKKIETTDETKNYLMCGNTQLCNQADRLVKKITFDVLDRTMNVIAQLTPDVADQKLKEKIMKYSIGLIYRMVKTMDNEFQTLVDRYNTISINVNEMIDLDNLIKEKGLIGKIEQKI